MSQENPQIRDFKDLLSWQHGHQFVLAIYKLSEKFPKTEIFGLTSQMRRAVVSITSNISEGFARKSYKEKIQFYYVAESSLIEVKNHLLIARDIGYITSIDYDKIDLLAVETQKLLLGLIRKSKSFN